MCRGGTDQFDHSLGQPLDRGNHQRLDLDTVSTTRPPVPEPIARSHCDQRRSARPRQTANDVPACAAKISMSAVRSISFSARQHAL